MYKIKETVIVEGTYDKIKLSGFLDGVILATGGFSVMKDKKKCETIKTLAEKTGIVILTDSDSAGFKIRNFVKQLAPGCSIKNAYIPEVFGKEKRKRQPGKEGLIGVEGISEEILIDALRKSGCEIDGDCSVKTKSRAVTKADLYALGLSGGENSAQKRRQLTDALGLPSKISANMLLDVINRLLGFSELEALIKELSEQKN